MIIWWLTVIFAIAILTQVFWWPNLTPWQISLIHGSTVWHSSLFMVMLVLFGCCLVIYLLQLPGRWLTRYRRKHIEQAINRQIAFEVLQGVQVNQGFPKTRILRQWQTLLTEEKPFKRWWDRYSLSQDTSIIGASLLVRHQQQLSVDFIEQTPFMNALEEQGWLAWLALRQSQQPGKLFDAEKLLLATQKLYLVPTPCTQLMQLELIKLLLTMNPKQQQDYCQQIVTDLLSYNSRSLSITLMAATITHRWNLIEKPIDLSHRIWKQHQSPLAAALWLLEHPEQELNKWRAWQQRLEIFPEQKKLLEGLFAWRYGQYPRAITEWQQVEKNPWRELAETWIVWPTEPLNEQLWPKDWWLTLARTMHPSWLWLYYLSC